MRYSDLKLIHSGDFFVPLCNETVSSFSKHGVVQNNIDSPLQQLSRRIDYLDIIRLYEQKLLTRIQQLTHTENHSSHSRHNRSHHLIFPLLLLPYLVAHSTSTPTPHLRASLVHQIVTHIPDVFVRFRRFLPVVFRQVSTIISEGARESRDNMFRGSQLA